MRRKQQPSAKNQYLKKKKEMPSGVDDLATHEEKDIQKFIQVQRPQQIQIPIQEGNSSEEEEEIDMNNRNNPDEQSRMVLGMMQRNRINEKNSFDVPMVNIRELSAFNQTEEGDAWKHISATLDAGSKIYGFRVDLVHQNTFKVLGGLHRTQMTNEPSNEEQKEIEQEQLRKKKLINTGGENTLEKNPANLDTNKYDLEFEIDPLFQQTSAKFDEAGAKGLLMNNLIINENLMLALDSEVIPLKLTNIDVNVDEYLKELRKIGNLKLCPELTQFREDMYVRGKDLVDQQNNRSFQDVMNPQMMNMDFNQEEIQYDQDDLMEEMNSQNSQQFNNNNNMVPQATYSIPNRFNLHTFEQAVSHIGTGKVFENEREQNAWMKLDMNNQLKKKVTKNKQKHNKKKNGLNFIFDDDDEDLDRQILQLKEKESYIQKPDFKFTQLGLLPRSYQIDKAELCQPFQISHLPEWNQEPNNDEFDEQLNQYDEQQPMTTQKPMSQNRMANRLNIPIKELKAKMWENLGTHIPSSQQKFGLEFNQVHSQVPNMLNLSDTRNRVSIQTSFVTMLHLANEEGLRFQQNADEDDFQIYRELQYNEETY